jgi:hypothetical protein
MADPTAPERHDPPTENACRVERDYGSGIIHVCEWTAGRCSDTHSCGCGLVWTATAPVPADDLRDRIAKALIARIKASVIIDPIKQPGTVGQPLAATEYDLADAVLAALAGDPGDLTARMAEAMRAHRLDERSDDEPGLTICVCGEQVVDFKTHWARVAMSVHWEDTLQLVAENAELRRRAELAEQASAEWQAACEAHAADSERLADGVLALEAERDVLKAAIAPMRQHLAKIAHLAEFSPETKVGELLPLVKRLLAALDAPETPGDAEEATDE